MSNANQITSSIDMSQPKNTYGELGLWSPPSHPQLEIMRDRLRAAAPGYASHKRAKPNLADPLTNTVEKFDTALKFQSSDILQGEEIIEHVMNTLLVVTCILMIAWVSYSIATQNDDSFAPRHSMIDLSVLEPIIESQRGKASASQVMRLPPPPPSLEAIEALEANMQDDVAITGMPNRWHNAGDVNQMDI